LIPRRSHNPLATATVLCRRTTTVGHLRGVNSPNCAANTTANGTTRTATHSRIPRHTANLPRNPCRRFRCYRDYSRLVTIEKDATHQTHRTMMSLDGTFHITKANVINLNGLSFGYDWRRALDYGKPGDLCSFARASSVRTTSGLLETGTPKEPIEFEVPAMTPDNFENQASPRLCCGELPPPIAVDYSFAATTQTEPSRHHRYHAHGRNQGNSASPLQSDDLKVLNRIIATGRAQHRPSSSPRH